MTKSNRLAVWRATAGALAAGRTLEEQIESIRKNGNHGVIPVLRAGVLASHGIAKPKEKAETCVIFGCYRPFTTPFLLRDYLHLLDILGIDYTYLDHEYCCGAPLAMLATKEQHDDILGLGRDFTQLNLELARQKGATTLAYCCAGCVHAARNTIKEMAGNHVYIVDLILDKLESRHLQIPPTTLGYFEGCHTFFRTTYPDARLDWKRYRQQLGKIEGLTIVDLPKGKCCKTSATDIIESAEKMHLDRILCSCNWCYTSLMPAATGRVQMISLPELLLQCLKGNEISC